jgi:hypothetical protein
MQNKFILFFAIACLFISCHKDSSSEVAGESTVFTAEVLKEITGNIIGYVYDENNKPVEGASVQIYSATTKTNKFGVFTFENAKVDQQGTYITVRKNGYILGSDMVNPSSTATNYAYVKMLSLETGKSFDASKGGTIAITGGGSIAFDAGAIALADGIPYSGTVNATAKLISPNDESVADMMPGALIGDAVNGNTVSLGTAGMIAVELRSTSGEKLNLLKGKKATCSIPNTANATLITIPLWYFDETKGRWKEEGKATLTNGNYVGEVSHFSFWNADTPFPLVNICGSVVYADGSPAKNVAVKVTVDGLNGGYGTTDETGKFCGKMPKGKKLTIKVRNPGYCEDILATIEVGPFNDAAQLDPIKINIPLEKIFIVSGKVICTGVAVPNATVVVEIKNHRKILKTKADGTFKENLSSLSCGDWKEYKIFAYNEKTNEASPVETYGINKTSDLVLDLCKVNCNLTGQIDFDCTDKVKITVGGGSGTYTYKWNTGETGAETKIKSNGGTSGDTLNGGGLYCVTVADATTKCEKVFCKTVSAKMAFQFTGLCESKIGVALYGGVKPYKFSWSGGQTTEKIDNPAQNFCLTVTDANGCTASQCATSFATLNIDAKPTTCNKDKFSLSTSSLTLQGAIIGLTNIQFSKPSDLQNLSVLKTGLTFVVSMGNTKCETRQTIALPQVKMMTAEPKHTTCGGCNDGSIVYTVGTDCTDCKIGTVKIFKDSDLNTDLSAQNTAKTLTKGVYFVVVEDAVSGCYVGFKKVEIK